MLNVVMLNVLASHKCFNNVMITCKKLGFVNGSNEHENSIFSNQNRIFDKAKNPQTFLNKMKFRQNKIISLFFLSNMRILTEQRMIYPSFLYEAVFLTKQTKLRFFPKKQLLGKWKFSAEHGVFFLRTFLREMRIFDRAKKDFFTNFSQRNWEFSTEQKTESWDLTPSTFPLFLFIVSLLPLVLHSRVSSWLYPQTLDKGGKACQEHILQLFTHIRKLRA